MNKVYQFLDQAFKGKGEVQRGKGHKSIYTPVTCSSTSRIKGLLGWGSG